LRQKGQFWTPDWVAEAMVAYALSGGSGSLFDPAVGAGAFLRAGAKVARELHCHISLTGTEIDPEALKQGHGSMQDDLTEVQIRDFIMNPPSGPFTAIVANPPYLRHHRLSVELKEHIRNLGAKIIGKSLDGRAGLHIYFLIQALHLLAEKGRLAFIVPADTCEGIFAHTLWNWILSNYRLDAVITFEPAASP
jgi:type I restriction-modification system DNA methylase subunit